ncbi:hypothetical protein M9H77_21957 [Catharanthus roseus]|uniref:Uncharacterized protein n=1 Tax=Catharanthus roseus TaxID=4058 RepID=A0ACC0AP58_CATRO|nr:hypothetical protein M9H77_21957 [Catharanthus roseus]
MSASLKKKKKSEKEEKREKDIVILEKIEEVNFYDWLISKSAFEEESFHGLAIFYRKYIKDFSTIASSLMDVPKKKTEFIWKICLHPMVKIQQRIFLKTSLKALMLKDKHPRSNLDVKRSKFCEVMDLPLTVGPVPTIAGRLLAELDCKDNTLPRPVGCTLPSPVGFKKEMTFCNLSEPINIVLENLSGFRTQGTEKL